MYPPEALYMTQNNQFSAPNVSYLSGEQGDEVQLAFPIATTISKSVQMFSNTVTYSFPYTELTILSLSSCQPDTILAPLWMQGRGLLTCRWSSLGCWRLSSPLAWRRCYPCHRCLFRNKSVFQRIRNSLIGRFCSLIQTILLIGTRSNVRRKERVVRITARTVAVDQ